MPWMWISSNNIWPFRFSSVDAGNIVRLLAPDIGLLFSSIFILRLCIKLLRPVPQVNLHENGIPPADPEVDVKTHQWFTTLPSECRAILIWLPQQEAETSDTESEDGSDSEGSSYDSSDETTVPVQSGPPQFVQKLIVFAAGLKVLLSAIMNTAGKVVVTLLLGLAGTTPAGASLHHSISVLFCPLHQAFCCVCVCAQGSHCPRSPQVCISECFSGWCGGGCSAAPSACSSSAPCVWWWPSSAEDTCWLSTSTSCLCHSR